jgi:hypothetical protein
VVHVRGAEGTAERLLTLIKNALPEVHPDVAPHLETVLKEGIEGRKLRGVTKDGPVFVAFLEIPNFQANQPPNLAVILGVTKYEDFRDNLLKEGERKDLKKDNAGFEWTPLENGEAIYFVNKKDYVVVTPTKEAAQAFVKTQPGLDGKISKELAARLLASDVGLFLAMDFFNKQYADQIKSAKETLTGLIDIAAGQAGKAQQGSFELIRKLIGPVFQAVEDSQGVLLTAEFRPTGLALHAQTEMRPGSVTATTLKDSRPIAFQELERLPAGQMYYSGLKIDPALAKALGGMLFGALSDPDSKEGKAIEAALQQLLQAQPTVRLDGVTVPPAGVQVFQFADPAKAVQAELKLFEALGAGGTFASGMLKEKPKIKPKAEKYKNIEFNSVQLTWDLEKMLEAGGAALPDEAKKQLAEGMKKVLGESMSFWFGTDGKSVVQVIAKDWKAAEKLLDQFFSGKDTVAAVKSFAETRKELPPEATFVLLIDAVQYASVITEFIKPIIGQIAPLPDNFPAPPEKGKVTFVGTAVTLKAERGSFDLFISAATAHEFYKSFVAPLRGGN